MPAADGRCGSSDPVPTPPSTRSALQPSERTASRSAAGGRSSDPSFLQTAGIVGMSVGNGVCKPGGVCLSSLGSDAALTDRVRHERRCAPCGEQPGGGAGAVRCQNAADTKRSARPQRCAGRNEGSRADPAQRARHGEAEAARRAAEWARAGKAVARHRESSAGSGEPERRGNSWRRGRNFPARRFHLFLLTAIPTAALPTSCPRAVLGAAPGRGADLGARQHRRSRRLHAAHAGSLPFRRAVPCRLQGRLGSDEGCRGSGNLFALQRAALRSSVRRQRAPSQRDPGTVCNCETRYLPRQAPGPSLC